jgi:hypothetical protein
MNQNETKLIVSGTYKFGYIDLYVNGTLRLSKLFNGKQEMLSALNGMKKIESMICCNIKKNNELLNEKQ